MQWITVHSIIASQTQQDVYQEKIKNNYYLLLTATKVLYFFMPTQDALKSSTLWNLIFI